MTNFQRNFSTGEVEVEGSAIYHKTEYRERRNHYAFFGVNAADRRLRHRPRDLRRALQRAARARGRARRPVARARWRAAGRRSARISSTWSLAPGETRRLVFVLGYVENPVGEKWERPGVVNKTRGARAAGALRRSRAGRRPRSPSCATTGPGLLGTYVLDSPDERLNRMVNIWNPYQCMVTFNMSRSASYFESGIGRGMGFRDSNQDLLGFVHLVPARARERILDIAATQFAGRQRLPPVPAADQARQQRHRLRLQRRPAVADRGRRRLHQGDRRPRRSSTSTCPSTTTRRHRAAVRAPAALLPPRPEQPRPARPAADRPRRLERLPQPQLLLRDPGRVLPDHRATATGRTAESVFIAGLFVHAAPRLRRARRAIGLRRRGGRARASTLPGWSRSSSSTAGTASGSCAPTTSSATRSAAASATRARSSSSRRASASWPGSASATGTARQALDSVKRAPRHPLRHRAQPAGLHALPRRAGRDLVLPAGLQGERRHLLPQQPVDHDRRDRGRPRRPGVRLLQEDRARLPRGDQRGPPHRALRLRADDRRQGRGRATARPRTPGSPAPRPGTSWPSPSTSSASAPSSTGCGSRPASGRRSRTSPSPGAAAAPCTGSES